MKTFRDVKEHKPHDPFIVGNSLTYMTVGYYPKEELRKWLPRSMSIPSDEIMNEKYPTVKKLYGMHPFMLMFSTNSNVHDVFTEYELRTYRELIFFIPVSYTYKKKEQQLCSYVPVLYLDFFMGVVGGLTLALRKQYRPTMTGEESDTSKSYIIKGIIEAKFQQISKNERQELEPFFVQTFNNPTLTISYVNRTNFYTTKVYPTKILDASPEYEWNYKGSVIKSNENTFAHYSEYSFTVSRAMSYKKYFYPKYPVEYMQISEQKI